MCFLYVYKYRKETGRVYSRTLTVVRVSDLRDEISEGFYLVLFYFSFPFFSVFSKFYTIINELLKNIFQLPSSIPAVVAGFHDAHL